MRLAVPVFVLALIILTTPPDVQAAASSLQQPRPVETAIDDEKGQAGTKNPPAGPTAPDDPDTTTAPADQAATEIEELKRRLDILAQEIEQIRSGEEPTELTEQERRALGLAPSAAATYGKRRGISFAGYGEMLYENYEGADQSGAGGPRGSQIDFLRLILYTGYRFSDRFVFNSEVEVEHGNEIFVEFAYVDWLARPDLTVRGGMLLVPLGLVNEFHEPTVFIGARRPETESRIIPSTWRENGAGVLGTAGPVNYRAYVVNGFNAAGFSSDGLRGGRQRGIRARASDFGFAGRVDVTPTPGVFVGAGLYTGGSAQDQYTVAGEVIDVTTTIVEAHAQAQIRGLDLRALFAQASLSDVAELNVARGLTGAGGIGETMRGGYVQAGYNVLSQVATSVSLAPYYRFEQIDTHAEVPAGYLRDPARDARFHTFGIELKPITNVVVKADYQVVRNDARTGRNQFNINLGYAF